MSDLMREGFEVWFSTNAPKMNAKACHRDAKAIAVKEMAFCSWAASRAALAVTLPPARDSFSPNIGDDCYCPDQLQAAFDAAGVKVISST